MISTRGQYAIRAILDIAEHDNGQPIPLHDISLRQKISLKYLEIIMRSLNKGGICLLYTSPSQRDRNRYRMPSSA